MTATQEIKEWREQFGRLKTDAELEEFRQKIHAMLSSKEEESLTEGMFALSDAVRELRLKAEKAVAKPAAKFSVFPATEKDREFLKAWLLQMKIPFEMSA